MKFIILVLILFTNSLFAKNFPDERSYRRLVGDFKTAEECEKFKRETGAWFNCFQEIDFETDGSATVMLTDIMNLATYSLTKDQLIHVEAVRFGDMPPKMEFLMEGEGKIIQLPEQLIWHRSGGDEVADVLSASQRIADSCFEKPTGRFRQGALCSVDSIECHEAIELICIDDRGRRRVRDSWERFSHCTPWYGNGHANCRQR